MVTKAPSYLTIRKGIYYFQMRVPAHFQHKNIPQSRIIRKSTGTGNFREALRISRGWWNLMMAGDFFKKRYPELAKAEEEINQHESMVNRGASILSQFKVAGIDENDTYAMDAFLEPYSGRDIECFYAAKEYYEGLKIENSRTATPSTAIAPVATQTPLNSSEPIQPSSLALMDVAEKWFHHNTQVRDEKKRWSKASIKKFTPQIRLMVEMVGNPPANEFTKALLRDEFSEKLPVLPDRLRQRSVFIDKTETDSAGKKTPILKSFDEIFEIADEFEIKRIKPRTCQDYANNITTFLEWAGKKEYIVPNTATVLEDLKEISGKDERRKAFNKDDLKKLFETEEYQKGLLFNKPYRHWVPLISLYTGCRLGEASQLYVENICLDKETGIWFFNFSEGDGQTLKSKASNRQVPIHRDLQKLGLLKYWEKQKNKGERQLFSELSADSSGHWGRHLSRWFNGEWIGKGKRKQGYKEKYGVVTNKERVVTFHSFRHYVVNRSKQEAIEGKKPKWDYSVWCEITGHSEGTQTVRQQSYEENYDLPTKEREMKKMKMDFLAIELIKEWR